MCFVNHKNIYTMFNNIETIDNPEGDVISFPHVKGGVPMSVSKAVRMALKKAGKQNGDLAQLWGYTLNATSNKFQWERWTGKELAEVAQLTGGQLAFVYPDGTQITIPQEDPKKDAKAEAKQMKAAVAAKPKAKKAEAPAAAKEKKAPAKPKKEKVPDVIEEQISFFE